MKNIQPSVIQNNRLSGAPYPFGSQSQYQQYVNCLNAEGISLSGNSLGFTAEQLQCAVKVLGTCPPGYQNRCENLNIRYQSDTPILSPAPGVNPANDRNTLSVSSTGGSNVSFSSRSPNVFRQGQYVNAFGDSASTTQVSNAQKAYLPSTFLKSNKQPVNRQQYGFVTDLDNNRFVSNTAQRISGGYVVPLAQPLQTASRTPRPIRDIELQNEPWSQNLQSLNNLSDTASSVLFAPKRISSQVNLGGRTLNNVPAGSRNIDKQEGVITNSTYTAPAFDQPAVEDISGSTIDSLGQGTALGRAIDTLNAIGDNFGNLDLSSSAIIDTENIRYNRLPEIELTPLLIDDSGDYVPAGPTARAVLAKATPEFTVTGESLLGIPENSEIYFNGQKVIIRGTDPQDIATQVNCANINITARTVPGAGGQPDLVLSSCNGSPWTVANGCAGGRYKQVGDFHINRGFEQQTNIAKTSSVTNNATIIPAELSSFVNTDGTNQFNQFQVLDTAGFPVLQSLPEGTDAPTRANYVKFFLTPDGRGPAVTSLIPQDTQTFTENRVFSTGGSGYRIGDRLRLVGGTPVNSSKAPLTIVCIDSAGAGYTNPANLEVIINADGNAPGIGAAATVTELDEFGGIANIVVVNGGAGYDIQNPPTIEIRDRSPATQTPTDISAAWPEEITLDGGSIVRILAEQEVEDASGEIVNQRTVFSRYVRTTAPVEFGTSQTYTKTISRSGNLSDTDIGAYFQEETGNFALVLNQRFTELDENVRRFSYIGISVDGGEEQLYWIPNVITFSDVADVYPNFEGIITPESAFTSQAEVEAAFPEGSTLTIRIKTPWWKNLVPGDNGERPTLVDTVDPRLQKVPAKLSAKIGLRPDAANNPDSLNNADSAFLDGYKGLAGPLRVAKFIVTAVDSEGGITALRVIDRGLYKIFPSDLTYGIPLEYDYESLGLATLSESGTSIDSTQRFRLLGVGDPARDNLGYGPGHPEYQYYPFTAERPLIRYIGPTPAPETETDESGTSPDANTAPPTTSPTTVNCPDYWYAYSTTDIVSFTGLEFTLPYETGIGGQVDGEPRDPEFATRMGTIGAGARLSIEDNVRGVVPITVVSNTFNSGTLQGSLTARFDSFSDAQIVFNNANISGGIDGGPRNRIGPLCKVSQSTTPGTVPPPGTAPGTSPPTNPGPGDGIYTPVWPIGVQQPESLSPTDEKRSYATSDRLGLDDTSRSFSQNDCPQYDYAILNVTGTSSYPDSVTFESTLNYTMSNNDPNEVMATATAGDRFSVYPALLNPPPVLATVVSNSYDSATRKGTVVLKFSSNDVADVQQIMRNFPRIGDACRVQQQSAPPPPVAPPPGTTPIEERYEINSIWATGQLALDVFYDNREPFPPFAAGVRVTIISAEDPGVRYTFPIASVGIRQAQPFPDEYPNYGRVNLFFGDVPDIGEALAEEVTRVRKPYLVFASATSPAPGPAPAPGPTPVPPTLPPPDGSPAPTGDDSLEPGDEAFRSRSRFFTPYKHPNWSIYPEFYWDGQRYQVYNGTPGDYDPSTFVLVNTEGLLDEYGDEEIPVTEWSNIADRAAQEGRLLRKIYRIDRNPLNESTFGQYAPGRPIAGGTGARLFLTSEEVPDCSEKSTAKETLGMPDIVDEINAPNVLVRALNDALSGAGYQPEDIRFTVTPRGDFSTIELEGVPPAINIDSPTPGFLENLGIPPGTYNVGILCLEGELLNPDLTNEEALALVRSLYDDPANNLGLLDNERLSEIIPDDPDALSDPSYILNLLCINRLGRLLPQPGGELLGPINDNNSVFHDAQPSSIKELYKYDITNIYGESVTLTGTQRQQAGVNIFESKRFNENNRIEDARSSIGLVVDESDSTNVTVVGSEFALQETELSAQANAWVDNYQGQGWAYLENGVVQLRQEPLVDIKAIDSALMYNAETGSTSLQLNFWDPFKGVLPGFIQNEIHFISDEDPVSYNNARTMFGKNTVGKVWWDTSTVRYEWYEQGTNQQRRDRWGRAFPGSSITVCEWIESTALPVNWNGNGIPRWPDRYITERRQDPATGEYKLYYYYWVQNRSVIDDRVARRWNRKWDTQTIARYISNPVGYGVSLANFVSTDGITLNNVKNSISDDDHHLQVNFDRNLNPNGLKHTAWKLMREGDSRSIVPDHLSDKLIDSLCGENALGQTVPDPTLSVVERHGIKFRPRQSMFRDVKSARRVMASTLNRILDNIKIRSEYPNWDSTLPAQRTYIQDRNWYAVLRTDPVSNEQIRYDASYKPVFNVNSVSDLFKLTDLPDGTVVQVVGSQADNNQLWQYIAREQDFRQISIFNETVRLRDSVFTDDNNTTLATELRLLLIALRDVVFADTELWNAFFFEMVKHAHMEQQQLDWAFKTTFLYVDKEEQDLVKFTGFKADNFQKVLDYMNEVKPYSAKIREYKDTKRAPLEIIGQNNISDYDKPPYPDPVTGEVRSLNTRDAADWQIMSADSRYIDYFTALANGDTTPLRKATTRLVFDRTHWQPTEIDWNPLVTTINQSMANNMAALNSGTVAESDQRAIDRIFLYDSEVRTVFASEVNTYYSNPEDFDSVITDSAKLLEMLEAGQLVRTLAMLKEKVGGGWRGETLDANGFNSFLDSTDYINEIITEFGFDSEPWDENTDNDVVEQNVVYNESAGVYTLINGDLPGVIGVGDRSWDSVKQVAEYAGVFNTETQGNITLVRNGEIYEGFDGVTFQRVLYGEERPEEMAVFGPLENLIITVTTTPYELGNVELDEVSTSAANVTYRIHENLFGGTDYFRISNQASTMLVEDLNVYSTEIVLADGSFLPEVTTQDPGAIWVGSERILFGYRNGNTLSLLTRGALGTTIQDHSANTAVYSAEESETFNHLNPRGNIWLDTGRVYGGEVTWDIAPGVDGVLDTGDDVVHQWDEIANANITVTTVNATVTSVSNANTVAEITLTSNLVLTVNEAVRVADAGNANIADVVRVSNIDGSNITVIASFAEELDSNVFVANANIAVSSFDYDDQANVDFWDAANVLADTALSLADRANADFTATTSIMRFLHRL